MADVFTKELKHMNMQHIRSKDTKAEAVLRKTLWQKLMMRFYILKRKVNECPTLKEFFNVKEQGEEDIIRRKLKTNLHEKMKM